MEQRAVSTGLMSAAAPIGVALGFLIGPSIVPVKAVDKVHQTSRELKTLGFPHQYSFLV